MVVATMDRNIKHLRRDDDLTVLEFDKVTLKVRVALMWGHECLYVEILTPNRGFDIVINDPTSWCGRNRASIKQREGNIFTEIGKSYHCWKLLKGFKMDGYVKAVVRLFRVRNKNLYSYTYDGWIGQRGAISEYSF